jgi:hypothetical protein
MLSTASVGWEWELLKEGSFHLQSLQMQNSTLFFPRPIKHLSTAVSSSVNSEHPAANPIRNLYICQEGQPHSRRSKANLMKQCVKGSAELFCSFHVVNLRSLIYVSDNIYQYHLGQGSFRYCGNTRRNKCMYTSADNFGSCKRQPEKENGQSWFMNLSKYL